MWAAIRYRRAQALVLVLLSALITSCAVLAPLYSRALEQGLLRNAVFRANPADTALSLSVIRSTISPNTRVDVLRQAVPPEVLGFFEDGIGRYTSEAFVVPRKGLLASPLRVIYSKGQCEHLKMVQGRCPTGADDVAISAADEKLWKWQLGRTFQVDDRDGQRGAPPHRMTVVGVYQQVPDDAYWLRTLLGGKSGSVTGSGLESVPALDDWVTSEATFTQPEASNPPWTSTWPGAAVMLEYPVNRDRITLNALPGTAAAVQHITTTGNGISSSNPMSTLIAQVRSGQSQVRLIVPLLMAQLGLLAAAVLLSVAAAAVEQRRPEVALARLRGRTRGGARRIVLGELGLTVLAGLPLGVALALLINEVARRLVLPPGVPFELRWPVLAAVALAGVVCLGSVAIASQPVMREPISSLLRRVGAITGRRGWSMTDLVVVTLSVAGIVGLATKSMAGPLALLTPTVLSLAVGLLLARLLAVLAARSGEGRLARGKVGSALAAFQLARRPALRKVVTIVTVATALIVFAANAVVVADRNRQARAQLESGAAVVFMTDSDQPAQVAAVARQVDPGGRHVTPVAVIQPNDPASSPTIAVQPQSFRAVSYPPSNQPALDLSALGPSPVQTLRLKGRTLTGEISSTLTFNENAYLPPGQPEQPLGAIPRPRQLLLRISVTTPDGQRLDRDIATVPLKGEPALRISAPLLCPQSCRLDAIEFRVADLEGDTSEVSGTIAVKGLALDGVPLHLGDRVRWQPSPPVGAGAPDAMAVSSASRPDNLVLEVVTTGILLRVPYADVPVRLPALLAGPVPPGGTAGEFQGLGLNGSPVTMTAMQTVPALPEVGSQGLLVNYETLQRLGGRVPDGASLQVWLSDPSPRAVDRVRTALTGHGIRVLSTHTYASAKQGYDRSASGWGLQLALVTGVMALLIGALVLIEVAVAGWRLVVRDFATLRMSGLPLDELRSAARLEQLVVVAAGVLAGALSGVVGAGLAMPLIPLFDTPAPVPVADLSPAWLVVILAILAAVLVLGAVALAIAVTLGKRFSLGRLRESL